MEEVQTTFNYFNEEEKPEVEPFSWTKYNQSQTKEKIFFMRLLRELCDLIEEPQHDKGRRPVKVSDMVYSLALKTYDTHSSRRCSSELKLANKAGFINKSFHFNTLLKYLENSDLTNILTDLIELSALPLKQVEIDFAVDSTGFSTSVYERWFDAKFHHKSQIRKFRKAHCVCGVKTHIITSVEVSDGFAGDITYFDSLVENTAKNFTLREVSADKAYSARKSLNKISKLGGIAFIPFKDNTSGNAKGSMLWAQMYKYFKEHQEHFMKRYHKRSNIESVFQMVKARFTAYVRCRNIVSQDNEILLKVLCHNICVLIQEIFMSNIEVDFRKCAIESECT